MGISIVGSLALLICIGYVVGAYLIYNSPFLLIMMFLMIVATINAKVTASRDCTISVQSEMKINESKSKT